MRSGVCFAILLAGYSYFGFAQGPPPAKVVVGTIDEGRLTPTAVRQGTVFFKEVSNLASEVNGIVKEVLFEEGEHIEAGAPMVRLDHVLLDAELEAAKALVQQYGAQLEQEKVRLERAKDLLKEEVTTPQEYDDIRFTVLSFAHRVDAAKADVIRYEREIAKKTIYAPFDGVVLERMTERGEWKREGDTVAVLARDDLFDVMVNMPDADLRWVLPDLTIDMVIAGESLSGTVVTVIPRGDTTMRTFPVKIRVTGAEWLLEAMTADVRMPVGEEIACTMAPRDAVLLDGNENVLFVVQDNAAMRVPVTILGYEGMYAGVRAEGLVSGMHVVTKGNERLRDGQPVSVIQP
jgi:RND family efflux transporter MFP subunit